MHRVGVQGLLRFVLGVLPVAGACADQGMAPAQTALAPGLGAGARAVPPLSTGGAGGMAAPSAGRAAMPIMSGGAGAGVSPAAAGMSGSAGSTGGAGMGSPGTAGMGSPAAGSGGSGAAGVAGSMPAAGTGGGAAPSPGAPTFSTIFSTILLPKCAACHGAGLLTLTDKTAAYMGLMNVDATGDCVGMKRVVPNNPAASVLVMALKAEGCRMNGRMPPAGNPLSSAEIDLVSAWIQAGAKND